MKIYYWAVLFLLMAASACSKRHCGCEPPPNFDYLQFVIVDKDSNSMINAYASAYKYKLFYLEGNEKKYVKLDIYDSTPKYRYSLGSEKAPLLSADNSIYEFYLDNGEDIDTVSLVAKRENELAYYINEVKFNSEISTRDTSRGGYSYVFRKGTP